MTNVHERLAKAIDNSEEERKESRQVVIAPRQHERDLLIDTLTLLASFDRASLQARFARQAAKRTFRHRYTRIRLFDAAA